MACLAFKSVCAWFQNPYLHPHTWTWSVDRRTGKVGPHQHILKLTTQGKHLAESTNAVSLEPFCVPGVAALCFSWWRIHHLEHCVSSCCCPPIRWGMSTAIHKSRVIGWEQNRESAGGLFIVPSPRLKRRYVKSFIISQGIEEYSGQGNKERPKGQGCIPIKMTSRHLTCMALS